MSRDVHNLSWLFVLLTMFAASFDLADQKSCKLFHYFGHDMRFMYVSDTRCSNKLAPIRGFGAVAPYWNESLYPSFPESREGFTEEYVKVPFWFDLQGFSTAFMNFLSLHSCTSRCSRLDQLLGDKSKAPQVFLGAMGTACTVYMALGGIAAYYFGMDPHYGIQKLITLNWRNYNGDEDQHLLEMYSQYCFLPD